MRFLLLVLPALAAAAGHAALAAPASAAEPQPAAAVYCVYVDPVHYGASTLYPGGRYCVPGP